MGGEEKPLLDRVGGALEGAYDKTSAKLAEFKRLLVEQGAPDVERECDFLIVPPNPKGKYVITINGSGGEKGEVKTLNKKEYFIFLYTYNLKVLTRKKALKEREKAKYELRITYIDEYVADRKEAYEETIGISIDTQRDFEYYRDKYDKGIGRDFYPGESQEKWLRGKMAEAAAKGKSIPNKQKFIYACSFMDIDNPGAGKQYFEDIMTLRSAHAAKVRVIKGHIKGFESKIADNKAFLKKCQEND